MRNLIKCFSKVQKYNIHTFTGIQTTRTYRYWRYFQLNRIDIVSILKTDIDPSLIQFTLLIQQRYIFIARLFTNIVCWIEIFLNSSENCAILVAVVGNDKTRWLMGRSRGQNRRIIADLCVYLSESSATIVKGTVCHVFGRFKTRDCGPRATLVPCKMG